VDPQTKAALPVLLEVIRGTEQPYIRQQAVNALGEVGPPAKAAVPALLKARKDNNLRFVADAALKKIDPRAAAKAGVR
jgi:HEAT repeat protein